MSLNSFGERRERILEQIRNIRFMRRGTINEQYLRVPQKNRESLLRGPYYVLSWNEGGRTHSLRIKPGDLEQAEQDVEAYKSFQALAKEFAEVTEAMTREVRSGTEDLKKTPSP